MLKNRDSYDNSKGHHKTFSWRRWEETNKRKKDPEALNELENLFNSVSRGKESNMITSNGKIKRKEEEKSSDDAAEK